MKAAGKISLAVSLIIIALSGLASFDALRGYFRDYSPGFHFLFKKFNYEQALRSFPLNADKLGSWELGRFIAKNTRKTDYIYDWGYGPELYYYSGRSAAYRDIGAHYLLMDARNPVAQKFPHVKSRQQELIKSLKEKPVKFFVVFLNENSNLPPLIAFQQIKDFPELDKFLQENYFLLTHDNQFLLFQRK